MVLIHSIMGILPGLLLFSSIVFLTNGIYKNCPFSCRCKHHSPKIEISCMERYWRFIPNIPKGSNSLAVRNGKFGVLKGPSSCKNFFKLKKLILIQCGITAVRDDSFKCMQGLRTLDLSQNRIKILTTNALNHLINLKSLNVKINSITAEGVKNLCILQNIESLDVSWNGMNVSPTDLDCFGNLNRLHTIYLSANVLRGSVKEFMKKFVHVKSIVAVSCNITSIEEDAFNDFRVKSINLRDNQITEIKRMTFANVTNLRDLIMSNNPIKGYDWISEMHAIERLNLKNLGFSEVPLFPKTVRSIVASNNPIQNLTEGAFQNLDNLEVLKIQAASIQRVENQSFHNLPALKILNLMDNRLRSNMLPYLVWGLTNSSLEELSLSSNVFSILSKAAFESFTPNVLGKLNLRNCFLEEIEPGSFMNFHHLTFLDLSHNHLSGIKVGTFNGLDNLESLDLASNRLKYFTSEFIGLLSNSLNVLLLRDNSIQRLNFHVLNGFENLKIMDFSRNALTAVKSHVRLPALQVLRLRDNRINYIEPGAFSGFVNLAYLTLETNRINFKIFSNGNIQNLTKLTELDLADTYIGKDESSWHQNIWATQHELRILSLKNCRFTEMIPHMFSPLTKLEKLILNINYITYVEPSAFKNTTQLQELSIAENRISHVNWESFIHLPKLKMLILSGNPLVCTCDILWILQMIRAQKIYFPRKHDIKCKPPGQEHFQTIHLDVTDCEEPWVLILKPMGIGFASVFSIFLLYLLWYFRWHVRYTLFLARTGRHRYKEMHDDVVYEYDAFVAYSEEDLPWVKKQLLPNVDLEYYGLDGFHLCLHHRDWLAGVDIAENIKKSIVESRRTIVVLSKAFAASYWCKLELAMAHMRLDAEGHGKDRLITILFDSIPDHLLTARLRHILTTKTYIAWPNEAAQQPLFWKAVRKALKKQLFYIETGV